MFSCSVTRPSAAFESRMSLFFASIGGSLLSVGQGMRFAFCGHPLSAADGGGRMRCCINYAAAVDGQEWLSVRKIRKFNLRASRRGTGLTLNQRRARQRSYIPNAYGAYAADVSVKSTAFERHAAETICSGVKTAVLN